MSTQCSMVFQLKFINPEGNLPILPVISEEECRKNGSYYKKISNSNSKIKNKKK